MKRFSFRMPSTGTTLAVVAIILAMVGTATAGSLITGKDIRNGSVTGKDLRNKSVKTKDLAPGARSKPATAYSNPEWGIIARNTIGSAVGDVRGGPFVTLPDSTVEGPPHGDGSLGLGVSDDATSSSPAQEKVSYGNEVDFVGDNVLGIAEVGFSVFTTGENVSAGEPMPNITLEIDANLDGLPADNYTSMVWIPDAPNAGDINNWSDYIDATSSGEWYLTGAEGTESGCSQSTNCSFSDLQAALADAGEDPSVLTVAVTKGRDSTFAGAVDGLRLNETIYDFEPFGVVEQPAS